MPGPIARERWPRLRGAVLCVEKILFESRPGMLVTSDSSFLFHIAELEVAAIESMIAVSRRYPKATTLAYTFRLAGSYFAVLQKDRVLTSSAVYDINEIIDKVGSGDCFMAGLLYGLYNQHPAFDIINFAAAAAVGKLYEIGDATKQTIEDIQQKIKYGSTRNN